MKTTDLYPELSPFERHILFVESLSGPISQLRYQELLKAHFTLKKKEKTSSATIKKTFKEKLTNLFTL